VKLLPDKYSYLNDVKGPRILCEALSLYGVREISGDRNNPVILSWAKEIGGWIGRFYTGDDIPWCGLFIAVAASRAKFPFGQKALSARAWLTWGQEAVYPSLGDVLVFARGGGGHVGLYVGEDYTHFHVLGGNQSNEVNIMRIKRDRLLGARRCIWRYEEPNDVRRYFLKPEGVVSEDER
tara:strand:+ start:1744 stop:2283 length:540 start_codon:yes stop_codon:yes gene_type:complete